MFDLKINEEQNTNSQYNKTNYQRPGIEENLTFTGINFGKSTQKLTPYIEITTKNVRDEVGKSPKMWLSTNKSRPDAKTTGWEMSKKNIVEILQSIYNVSKDEIATNPKFKITPDNEPDIEKQYQYLVNSLSALIVGKSVRGKFKGEQTKEGGPIWATLDKVESMNVPKESSRLSFDSTRDIKHFMPIITTGTVDSEAF